MINDLMTHLWQSTLFAVAAALLTLAFRKNRAKVRFSLWLSASLKFFIPFSFLVNLGSRIHWAPVTEHATPAVVFAVEYVAQPFSGTVSAGPAVAQSTDWIPIAVAALWICGLLAIAAIRLKLWTRVRAAVRASTPLEIPAPVGIRSAPGLLEPGVVGVLNPVLLLPEGIVDRLTPSELEAVLAHELCHVRRRDNLFATAHMIVEAVFWFHPLVWWIGARLLDERERACDEDVLHLGNQPRVYADAILNVCKLYTESPLVCVSGVTGADIRGRIEAIMTNRRGQTLNYAKKTLLAAAGALAIAGPVAVGIVIGIGHVPAILAQSPIAPLLQTPAPVVTLAQATPAPLPASRRSTADRRSRSFVIGPALFGTQPHCHAFRFQRNDAGRSGARPHGRNRARAGHEWRERRTIMLAGTDPLRVVEDFTDNKAALQTAIQNLNAPGNGSEPSVALRLGNIETAAKMLAAFPQKKSLMYFSTSIAQSGDENQAALKNAIDAAKRAMVVIYPIDVRPAAANPELAQLDKYIEGLEFNLQQLHRQYDDKYPPIRAAQRQLDGYKAKRQELLQKLQGAGRSMTPPALAAVTSDEYNRRLAYVQEKFNSTTNALARTYLRYGAPDQIDAPNPATAQIWRYNYLANFHSSTEFAFSQGKGAMHPWFMTINYPQPPMYHGTPATDATLVDALKQEDTSKGHSTPMNTTAGLPVRHTSIGANPAGEASPLMVPLDNALRHRRHPGSNENAVW